MIDFGELEFTTAFTPDAAVHESIYKMLSDSRPTNVTTLQVTYLRKVWLFPPHRFIEYEPSDEAWARPLGFGREIDELTTMKIDGHISNCEAGQVTFTGNVL